jgi:Ca-activated chloride channel homolog
MSDKMQSRAKTVVGRAGMVVLAAGIAACGTSSSDEAAMSGGPYPGSPSAGAYDEGSSGETYEDYGENDFIDTATETTSTFGADVDTASYTIMRRDITAGHLPDEDSVRIEEYVNYFKFDYPSPSQDPFAVNLEMAPSYFGEEGHKLLRIGIKGKEIPLEERDPANIVFLVDVSGSMGQWNKLPLVQWSLKQLVQKLAPTDTLGIAVYASADGAVLQPTAVENKASIYEAIDAMQSGGSTNGEAGIRLAYQMAEAAFRPGGTNRVVICTDGDFNVGLTGDALVSVIEDYRSKGIFLTMLGFGQGNINDAQMEQLADKGNGNYAYIDTQNEALRVLGENLVSTLQVIAKDVKIQVEFDPEVVSRYRLVGYENRVMSNEDFTNDMKDSGDLGAGHYVTAFYELETLGEVSTGRAATVRIRYKEPTADVSRLIEQDFMLENATPSFEQATQAFRFASAVTEYAEILRSSKHSTGARFDDILGIAQDTAGGWSDRQEFVDLVEKAKVIHGAK